MKVHQMLVHEIVRNLEFRKEFLSEFEKFAEIAIEFHPEEIKEESIALAQTGAPAMIDVGEGYILVCNGELIIEGDQFLSNNGCGWINCVSTVGDLVLSSYHIRRQYRPRYGWRMQEGWRELSEQELLQEGDEINSVSNAGNQQDEGWTNPSRENLGKLYSWLNMVARRRIA